MPSITAAQRRPPAALCNGLTTSGVQRLPFQFVTVTSTVTRTLECVFKTNFQTSTDINHDARHVPHRAALPRASPLRSAGSQDPPPALCRSRPRRWPSSTACGRRWCRASRRGCCNSDRESRTRRRERGCGDHVSADGDQDIAAELAQGEAA